MPRTCLFLPLVPGGHRSIGPHVPQLVRIGDSIIRAGVANPTHKVSRRERDSLQLMIASGL